MQSGATYATFKVKFVLKNLRILGRKILASVKVGHSPIAPQYTIDNHNISLTKKTH
ncbi:hypothetical protein HOLleu_18430 [Holothuria leucospilota]|uniref:Uncharacterized protein n=1 Tax=Holothuria leucospilota TaxID=206669 RepID=A0A9Q1C427_HOLLE|nr:hypothetical protein HOLleu_18430 [Holothuria leucospilota]